MLSSEGMDLVRARFLVSEEGQRWLTTASGVEEDSLRLQRALRRALQPAEAAAIAEQAALRARARRRFGTAYDHWLWTPATIEMATHPAVAARRAARLARLGRPVLDGTLGAGADADACAANQLWVLGLERDAVVALLAAHNLRGHRHVAVVRGDVRCPPVPLSPYALLLDPSRRQGPTRTFAPTSFQPSWGECLALARDASAAAVKAPPGIAHDLLPADAEVEWVQLGGSLREATLWFGEGARPGLRRAVILDAAVELASDAPTSEFAPGPLADVLYDPEPAVTRAGLVAQLAAELRAWPLADGSAYLTGTTLVRVPFARAFAVLEVLPFSVRRLRERLRARGWRLGEVLRRRFPVEPDELRRLTGQLEGEPVAAVCTTVGERRVVILCRALEGDGARQ